MANENPFFITRIECPICKTINEFETIRVGAYTEGDRDTDFCPRDIVWRYSRYQAFDPLVFFTVTCTNCFYTREFTNSFKDWKKDNTFKTYRLKVIKAKHLEKLAVADSAIRQLGENIDISQHPNEAAVIKLHLAAIDESFNEHYSRLDMGRFYLRIGWVYRHMQGRDDPGSTFVSGLMHDMDNRMEQLKNSLAGFEDRVIDFQKHVANHLDSSELTDEFKAKMGPHRDGIYQEVTRVRDGLENIKESFGLADDRLADYRVNISGEGACGGENFGGFPSFVEFMVSLRKDTNAVVVNETEALGKAVHYYKDAFANGKDIAPGNQQIQAAYLIAELSRRVGDHDNARQYFNTTIKLGQEFIYQNRRDQSRTALARKILELAIEQGRINLKESKEA